VDDTASQWLVKFDPILASCTHNTSPRYSVQHRNILKDIKLSKSNFLIMFPVTKKKKRQHVGCYGLGYNITALF